ncbi:rhodanese-like domain-containing protein [Thiomicrorhabdus lithotrophica]|uniref:Rhodanese-like domain-containing protein n=1 Tax=Thiomicrorhabdus lithotrophica TaxID=2949997 RepID=A0ABY8CBQ4_9GAMM|nr:rhodanese-like domain-containing protein [Thiomicrorhabdus lithotrophica]WEJ62242.1 rhodanese-like domain-containing protein [Thiomicrorhabdus lithotrophica]
MLLKIFLGFTLIISASYSYAEQSPITEKLIGYMEFASYSDGTITQAQVKSLGMDNLFIIDARSKARFEAEHIQGAINIEWRQTLHHLDEIPTDKTVVLYCDSGLLSSKAHFALKLVGYENVRVLLGGYADWK